MRHELDYNNGFLPDELYEVFIDLPPCLLYKEDINQQNGKLICKLHIYIFTAFEKLLDNGFLKLSTSLL